MEQTAQPNQIQSEIPSNTPLETPPGSSKTMLYVLGGVCILVVLLVGYFVTRRSPTTQVPQQQVISQPTMEPKPTLARSKAPGIITNVITASSLDAQGNAASPTATFTTTDKTIYLVLTCNNAKMGTKFEYVRYLNNKLLDSGALKIMKPNLTNASFVWSLKNPGATHVSGTYGVKVYTNGVFEKETSYIVR